MVGGVVGILGGVCQYLLRGMVTYSIERPRVHVLPNNSQTGLCEDRKASNYKNFSSINNLMRIV